MKKTTLLYVIVSLVFTNFTPAQSKLKAIKAGSFIDVVSGTMLKNQIILIQNDTKIIFITQLSVVYLKKILKQ